MNKGTYPVRSSDYTDPGGSKLYAGFGLSRKGNVLKGYLSLSRKTDTLSGGEVVFAGSLDELTAADTLTGKAIRREISVNKKPLQWTEGYEVKDAHCHNLKHIDMTSQKRENTCQ